MILNSMHQFVSGWIKGLLPVFLFLPVLVVDAQIPPPTFTNCDDVEVCSFGTKDDLIQVDLQAEVINHCVSNPGLYWTTHIDLYSDGSVDQTLTKPDASGEFPLGIHTIMFWAADGCGGVSSCQRVVTVKDCKKPTPICQAVTIAQLPITGAAEIWATILEIGDSYDNVTDYDNLQFLVERLEKVGPGQNAPDADAAGSVVVTCDDMPPVTKYPVVEVAIWVGDEAGNWDYCVTTISVEDWGAGCGSPPSPHINCYISNEELEPVSLVTVDMSSSNGTQSVVTNSSGVVSFYLFNFGQYTIAPFKDINPMNGINTYDLLLMERHLLGLKPLSSPYKLIAADINNNCEVSIADIVALRKMILDPVNAEFKNNSSWRFVDGGYTFPNPNHPCDFTETKMIEYPSANGYYNASFIAVKIGDVSGDHTPDQLLDSEIREARSALSFRIQDRLLEPGHEYEIAITAKDVSEILAYQYTLEIDPQKVAFINVTPQWADLDRSNFGLAMTSEGKLTTSWNGSGPTSVADGEVLYTVTLRALANGLLSQALQINSSVTPAMAYQNEGEEMDIQLQFTNDPGDRNKFELFQNEPNPFSEQTRIRFYLPEAGEATLTVHDVKGSVLFKSSENFGYGIHEFELNKSELPTQGMLYFSVQCGEHIATRQMIVKE